MQSTERPDAVMYCLNCQQEMAWRAPYFVCENVECMDPEWAEAP